MARQTRLSAVHLQGAAIFVRLNDRLLFWAVLTVVLLCATWQLVLDADPLVLALAVIASIGGLMGFRIAGGHNCAGWLVLSFIAGSVILSLFAKTLFSQPIDSHLHSPLQSFLVLFAGFAILLLAVLISLVVPVGAPLFRPVKQPQLLDWLSNWTFVLGALAWYLNRLFQDPDGSGFGGLSVFWNLLLMSVITRTAFVLQRTEDQRSIDGRLLMILGACVAMGFINNSKTNVALPIAAYFATTFFYRKGLTFHQAVAGLVALAAATTLVAPMIHASRALGIQDISWQERISQIKRGVNDALVNRRLDRYQQLAFKRSASGYYDYFGHGSGQILLGRYAAVQQIDPVVAKVTNYSALGGEVIWPAFARLVPSFINPNKPRHVEGRQILVHLGLIDPAGGKYPTVPLVAQAYAGYGIGGLLVIPLLTFTSFLLVLKKLGWDLYRNIFAIFFFCVFIVVYAHQGDLNQYAGAVLRNFPLLALVLWLLTAIYKVSSRAHLWQKHTDG